MLTQDELETKLDEIRKHRDETKEKRFRFLYALYQLSESYSESDLKLDVIMSNSKLDEHDAIRVARYLFDEGLIANRATFQRIYSRLGKVELEGSHLRKWNPDKLIRITHKGIVEVEAALDSPEKPTEHFPANIINYTISVGTMIGSEIHTGPLITGPATEQEKVRMTFFSANPKNEDELQLIKECNNVRDRIRFGEYGEQFDFDQRHQVSFSDMDKHLLDYKPQILHFSGHGSREGIIIFEDSHRETEGASIEALSELFRIVNGDRSMTDDKRIRLVFLSTCYSQKQAEAISKYVDCVVGMPANVRDIEARVFAESFYQAIGYGKSIKTAFELGCSKVIEVGVTEENMPRLNHQPDVDPSKIYFGTKVS